MSQWSTPRQQVGALAKAVSAAFAASNLTPEQKHPGMIELTDLPWSAPPLLTDLKLGGIPLQDYLDIPVRLNESSIYRLWHQTLEDMWYRPSRILRNGVMACTYEMLPKVYHGHRAFRFSTPIGYPAALDAEAGHLFTLELVHTIRISAGFRYIIEDDSNYYLKLHSGEIIGIKDGKVACHSPWDLDLSGQIGEMLRMSRGDTDYRCHFDQVASVRSVLHTHRSSFPGSFEALDTALQTLRIVGQRLAVPALIFEMRVNPADVARLREREAILADAIEMMDEQMPDRDKLKVLRASLVPGVVGVAAFKQNIYASMNYPFALPQAKLRNIEAYLMCLYQALPPDIKKAHICNREPKA